jgi:hypothetical protein
MKKFFSLIAAVLFAGSMMADVVISGSEFAGQGTESTGSEVSATVEGVTFTCDKAYSDDAHNTLRCYKNGNITITASEQIGKLVFQFYSTYNGGLDEEVVVNANEWNYALPSQARIEQVTVVFGDAPVPTLDTIPATEAFARAQELAENTQSATLVVDCYVASIKTAYSEEYGNITVWLNDDPTSTYGNIQAYRANCTAEVGNALQAGDHVFVTGKLSHSTYESEGETKHSYQIAQGAELVMADDPQGIENVVLTEKAKKVVVDGMVFIVRDGKMFNLTGAQVR